MFGLNKLAALIITVFVVIMAVIVFLLKIMAISLPSNFEEYDSSLITETCKVYYNHYGIPHIIAKNELDAFFMAGYCQARDRIWQMDYMRRAAKGELSEILGSEAIYADKFMRALELKKISNNIVNSLDVNLKSILESYCKGVNEYIKHNIRNLPFEFTTLGYIPKNWEPVDCILIGRLMAFQQSSSFWSDIALGEIADKIGVPKALSLIPSYPANAPYVTDDTVFRLPLNNRFITIDESDKIRHSERSEESKGGFNTGFFAKAQNDGQIPLNDSWNMNQNSVNHINNENIKQGLHVLTDFSRALDDVTKILQFNVNGSGSNSWAVRKTKSESGGAIIANDPHLAFGIPAVWYQIHISCPTMNVIGLTIPGLPFVFSGRNDNISWGITNVMADDCDFYIEKTDSSDANIYFTPDGRKNKFTFEKDTIIVKNSLDIVYYTRSTKRSAVISDFHFFNNPGEAINLTNEKQTSAFFRKFCLTYSWTGQKSTHELMSIYKINKATNWKEFVSATNLWSVPALNFSYADKNGNIGISPTGLIPVRKLCSPNIPNPGWLDGYNWEGFVISSELPKIYNPTKNFVASANNATSRNFNRFITSYWEPPSRAERISDLLDKPNEFSSRDMEIMQSDLLSPYAKQLLSLVIPIMDKQKNQLDPKEKEAFERLKKWDFIMSPLTQSPSIYNSFFERLVYNTFNDELGERLYREYTLSSSLPTQRIIELLQDTSSSWFDDINTKGIETKDYIVLKSFKDAVSQLIKLFDTGNINEWTWGKIHTLTLKHVFSRNEFLKPGVTIGPLNIGGNNTTINCTSYKLFQPYEVVLGASMRYVADMEDSVIFTSLPGGASGEPYSPNYSDQVQIWLNGGYVRLPVSNKPGTGFDLRLVFNPKGK